MLVEAYIIGFYATPVIEVTAPIAKWCFKKVIEHEKGKQIEIKKKTYTQLKNESQKQWEAQQEARQAQWEAQQEAHNSHYEMLGDLYKSTNKLRRDASSIITQIKKIKEANNKALSYIALTSEQRQVIQETNDQLERGIKRLMAYKGPYLQYYFEEIREAQLALSDHEYEKPDLPNSTLPEDFPVEGELLEFDINELNDYPLVNLNHGEQGRFITPSPNFSKPTTNIKGIVKKYIRDEKLWTISQAEGDLASDILDYSAFKNKRHLTLYRQKNNISFAWWIHTNGEKINIQLPWSQLKRSLRFAPWGTPIEAYLHKSDFFLKNIQAGSYRSEDYAYNSWIIPCDASPTFWESYEESRVFSDKLIIREASLPTDPKNSTLILRLSTGIEYPVQIYRGDRMIIEPALEQPQLGLAHQGERYLFVFLLTGQLTQSTSADLNKLRTALQTSFEEQKTLNQLIEADTLEYNKYKTVLQAEYEHSQKKEKKTMLFSKWEMMKETENNLFHVKFIGKNNFKENSIIRITGQNSFLGCSTIESTSDYCVVAITFEQRIKFKKQNFHQHGSLEATTANVELQHKIDALNNFFSAATSEAQTIENKKAFTQLRHELLGKFPSVDSTKDLPNPIKESLLDEHQSRAAQLINGTEPVILIQGPPGTGKTHTIAYAIRHLLKSNRNARIAITSQANPAVDEAISKILEILPKITIYRDYSASAKEKFATMDKGVGLDNYSKQQIDNLDKISTHQNPQIKTIQEWLTAAILNDLNKFEQELKMSLTLNAQIVACTLSRLANISKSSEPFDLIIIDEAAKASIPEAMIAANCTKRLILVGDHHQLLPYFDESYYEHSAPTHDDEKKLTDLWNSTLFSRLWNIAPKSRKAFLASMRRSRKPIADCISACFYNKELIAARDNSSPSIDSPLSLVWIDSKNTRHQKSGETSINNLGEVKIILQAIKEVLQLTTKAITIGVITFHRGQATAVKQAISKSDLSISPDILTVDASQGGQWDVVILSLARTYGGSGFIGNPNRLNVAISRAKEMCIIVGNLQYSLKDKTKGSSLSQVSHFIASQHINGVCVCSPRKNGKLPHKFGYPS